MFRNRSLGNDENFSPPDELMSGDGDLKYWNTIFRMYPPSDFHPAKQYGLLVPTERSPGSLVGLVGINPIIKCTSIYGQRAD